MQWLNKIVDEVIARHPKGEILIESGGSPSGTYHLGHLRELITADAILLELRRRGRKAKHIYYADDLDALRKIPVNIPKEYEKHLGKPLCDIPAPEGKGSYADYILQGLIDASAALGMEIEFIRSYKQYRAGFFVQAIEKALEQADTIRGTLENISGHQLGDEWSVVQVMEDGYLKNRQFVRLNSSDKTLVFKDRDGKEQTVNYGKGEVKLNWRVDWPARWWLLGVHVEPFGRDHATKGGSYDTGVAIVEQVFGAPGPLPVPYDFVNMAGDTKKMSASKGTGLDAQGVVKVLPPEIIRFFMLAYPPSKRLYFDPQNGVSQVMDEFAELLAKSKKTDEEQQLLDICLHGITEPTVSNIPFSHLVASYQAALKDSAKTLEIIKRTEHAATVQKQEKTIRAELAFIDQWLQTWAPEDVKFELTEKVDSAAFSKKQQDFLKELADKIEKAPKDADGEWFHKAIYDFKDKGHLTPQELFGTLYTVLIGKDAGPRAGWFLSTLPRDWLIKRLKLQA
ncbi:MAG TPA: lysine--tRNA ligase [Candidatus Saccharimonadales bacterium]|nr:lysine--tRNA ligase [Candidatus Saccharimonadales bacterium]